jgi:Rab GDP dissociation inhibitor
MEFFTYIQEFNRSDPKTHKGNIVFLFVDFDHMAPFKDLIKKFGLGTNTVDFIGHAVALYTNDDFIENSSLETIDRIKLYMSSIGKYGDSPFIYPIWGLSGISEGFIRLCAIYGGTCMLNRDIDEILYDESGKFLGIKSQGEIAYGKVLVTDPSYVVKYNRVKSKGKIIRCICIMEHPVPIPSCQIILPQRQIGRNNGNIIIY